MASHTAIPNVVKLERKDSYYHNNLTPANKSKMVKFFREVETEFEGAHVFPLAKELEVSYSYLCSAVFELLTFNII